MIMMMNMRDIEPGDTSKYRLIGNSVLGYRFSVPHDERIHVGDILKITDESKNLVFFAKISDLLHDSNYTDPRWDTRPHTDRFYGLGDNVFLTAEASPLGYVDMEAGGRRFRKANTIPTKFSRVEHPSDEDFGFLTEVMGEIEVGVMKTGHGPLGNVKVALHSAVLPQHMGVFATTGMGKSNFMKVFCVSCMKERKFGLLMVDPHGEYLAGGRSPDGSMTMGLFHSSCSSSALSVYTIRSEKERKTYSANRLYLDYDDFRSPDLLLLYDHSQPQKELVEMLEDSPGSDVIGFFTDTDFNSFDPEYYEGEYPEIAHAVRNFSLSTLNVMQRRIRGLINGNRSFLRQRGSSLKDIIKDLHANKVVLIDIKGMGERSELLVLSILAREILRIHQGEDGGEPLEKQVLITIDEAQRVLGPGTGSTRTFRECAMEGRKFGVGLCVITQQPRNIDSRILAQINTFVVMGLSDRNDRATVEGSAKQDLSRMDTEIQTLEVGEAVISTLGIPFPVSTLIHRFEDYVHEDAGVKPSAEQARLSF